MTKHGDPGPSEGRLSMGPHRNGGAPTPPPAGRLEGFATRHPRLWSKAGRAIAPVEHLVKKPVWGCEMCGQCILHDTGLTCPMGCPKNMRNGPCGGLGPNGECEVKPEMKCVWLKAHERDPKLPWRGHIKLLHPPVDWRLKGSSSWLNYLSGADRHASVVAPDPPPIPDAPRTDGRFEALLREGRRWVIVGEMNPPDGADLRGFVALGQALTQVVDVVTVTEHPSARNHMSSLPAAAALEAAGVESIATFTCRDRNRIALQGDLLGAAALGIRNALLVTGNHMVVGDHPNAKPVFDLDSINLLRLAKRLRDEGRFESGRALDVPPSLFLGGAAAPFAEPRADRAARIGKKATAGADFIISQHVYEPDVFRRFVRDLYAQGTGERLFVLGAVAVLPSAEVAKRLNKVLTGFQIPAPLVRRLEQAKDPQDTGIEIAAEIIAEMRATEGVSGNLIAALAGGAHVMTSTEPHEVEITREVVRRAGLEAPARAADGARRGRS